MCRRAAPELVDTRHTIFVGMIMWIFLAAILSSSPAEAACDSLARRALNSSSSSLPGNFRALARCSQDEAEAQFDSLLPRAKSVDSLVQLCMTAIDSDVWGPVWKVLSHDALDYDVRDQVAEKIGSSCAQKPKVVKFLKGAYFGLRDIEFQQWDDALVGCQSPDLDKWLTEQAEKPPKSMFDEKYNALLSVVVSRKGVDALPHLTKAAINGAHEGPFDAILMQMEAAVRPGIGEPILPESQVRLEASLVEIASNVNREKARSVADRLANAGAQDAAAQLLSKVYPDRISTAGRFTYGAVSIERAVCDGEKSVVLHVAKVDESGKRWIILNDVRPPMQAVKPKLGKCSPEGTEWGVSTTAEPIASSKEIDSWVDSIEKQWIDKGYDVSVKKEKTVTLD
jgi:hypothetical protein